MKKSYTNVGGISLALISALFSFQVQPQTRIIKGTVTAENQPVSGVSISQLNSDQTAVTNSDGTYQLQITTENPTLIFRHPDYAEQRVSVTNQTVVNISLKQKVSSIEEVVLNAGYYNVKAKESTGSIAKVSAKDIVNQPVNNVLSAVQGRMSGVSITNNSGNAGGGFDIAIRGQNSLRFDGNAPLIIVNGIPLNTNSNSISGLSTGALSKGESSPLNSINPDDIESFEVLKDADATAIYGSRGANGVILITTKNGSSRDITAEIKLSTSISQVNHFIDMASTAQYKKLRQDAFRLDGITTYPSDAYDLNGTWDNDRYTDFYKTFLGKTILNQQQEFALSGGNDNQQMRLSFFNSQQGTAYGNKFIYKRSGFSFNSTAKSKNGKLKVSPSISYTIENNRLAVADLTRQIFLPPNAPALFLPSGDLNWENSTFENPLAQLENRYTEKTKTFAPRLLTEYHFLPDFTLRLNAGYSHTILEEFKTSPSTQYDPVYNATSQYSSITKSNTSHENWIVEPQFNWDKKWSVNKLNALFGTTFEERTNTLLTLQGSDFSSNELLYNLSNANVQKVLLDNETDYRYQAVYARINYTLKDRYILNATARRDGSSRFGVTHRFANFGAGGAAWIFSEEPFLKESTWLSFGKLRGSYGVTGSDQIGDYQYLNTYTISPQSYDGIVGLYPSRLYNPDFTWEKTRKLECALELGFFKDLIHLTTAYYQNRSSNQLVGVPLAATTGFTTIQQNFPATVQNTGLEMDLGVQVIRRKNLKWNFQANMSLPNSKLISFPDIESSSYANTYVVGKSLNIRKVYEYTGIDKTTGIYQFRDFNGDGKITTDDREKNSDFGIKFFGGLSTSLQYKNISLQMLWQFVKQTQFDTVYSLASPGTLTNVPTYLLDYWTPENPNATYQKPTSGADSSVLKAFSDYKNSDAVLVDASFIRLNSLQLTWQLPAGMIKTTDLELGFQGQNLWTISPYKGLDPEVRGLYLPTLKTYSLTASLKF
jgi:TonB-linked SusC/RagA family outer membrane protein